MSLLQSYKPEFRVGNGSIKFTLAGAVFEVTLDHRGVPHCTESLRQQLPSYMPEVLQLGMRQGRCSYQDGGPYREHAVWCAKMRHLGNCNCDPAVKVVRTYRDTYGHGTLSCVVCNASSIGEIFWNLTTYDGFVEAYEFLSTDPHFQQGYWRCPETICGDCADTLWGSLDIEFVDDAESNTTEIPNQQ